jgi:L-asparaginase II
VAAHDLVSELSGIPKEEIPIGIEGCSVSSFYLPLWAMGYIYARLSDPKTLPEKYRLAAARVTAAMMANPEMVAGTYSFASLLMQAHKGRIFAKNGAEGVFCLGLAGKGIGFAMKIDDGSDRGYHTAVTSALLQFGVMPDEGTDMSPVKPVKNNKGNLVGEIRPGFTLEPVAGRLVAR